MDIIKRNRLLIWTAIILLIGNISIITTIWYKTPKRQKIVKTESNDKRSERTQGGFLINELNLNDDQVEMYKDVKIQHMHSIRTLRDSIKKTKLKIHEELFKQQPDTIYILQLADSIGLLNAEFEKLNYSHFLSIKEFLDTEQLDKLKEIMNHHSFTGEKFKRHRHRTKRE